MSIGMTWIVCGILIGFMSEKTYFEPWGSSSGMMNMVVSFPVLIATTSIFTISFWRKRKNKNG